MEIYLIIGIVAAVAMAALAYIAGSSGKKKLEADVARLEGNVAEQNRKLAAQEARIAESGEAITRLTADRDVQKANAANYLQRLEEQKQRETSCCREG